MTNEENTPVAYTTLEEILKRKEQLSDELEHDRDKIYSLWGQLFFKQENSTKGEYVASLVANTVTAIDAFLLVRKLMKNYSGLFSFFKRRPEKNKRK